MKQFALALAIASALSATALVSGCFPLVVAGAATGALVATDRRSAGAQVDDTTIEAKLMYEANSRWSDRAHINVTSYNGIVLLTGEAPDPSVKSEIASLARATARVRSVEDDVVVGSPTEIGARTQDTYLTSLVKARFLEATDKFSATHVKVVTERSVVYLMGIVRRAEGDAAAQIAATSKGVARVVKVFEYID